MEKNYSGLGVWEEGKTDISFITREFHTLYLHKLKKKIARDLRRKLAIIQNKAVERVVMIHGTPLNELEDLFIIFLLFVYSWDEKQTL